MLTPKMLEALNKQVAEENYACNYYLSMASWCDKNGLPGAAKFLFKNSEQERQHMMKLFHYINDAGGHAIAPAVKQPPMEFKNLLDVFQLVLEHEKYVTRAINQLVDLCLNEKDYSTFYFLQWYVGEQHEEEHLLGTILDLIKIAGLEGRGLFLVDKEIGKKAALEDKE